MAYVVLVHGSLSSAKEWDDYARLLPDHDVVAIDLPGHGTRVGERFTTRDALDAIASAIDAAPLGEPVVLAGHSLGGYLALLYASQHPYALAGLGLLGASTDPNTPLAAVYRGFAWLTERIDHDRLARLRDRIARLLGVPDQQLPTAAMYRVLPDAWRSVIDDCGPELLAQVTCPVLLINGQFDQMRLSERRFLSLAANARLHIVPRASHLAPLTHPDQVAGLLAAFISDAAACLMAQANSRATVAATSRPDRTAPSI